MYEHFINGFKLFEQSKKLCEKVRKYLCVQTWGASTFVAKTMKWTECIKFARLLVPGMKLSRMEWISPTHTSHPLSMRSNRLDVGQVTCLSTVLFIRSGVSRNDIRIYKALIHHAFGWQSYVENSSRKLLMLHGHIGCTKKRTGKKHFTLTFVFHCVPPFGTMSHTHTWWCTNCAEYIKCKEMRAC